MALLFGSVILFLSKIFCCLGSLDKVELCFISSFKCKTKYLR